MTSVARSASDIMVLLCVREGKRTEAEVRKKYHQLYPSYVVPRYPAFRWVKGKRGKITWVIKRRKPFDVTGALGRAVAKQFLKKDGMAQHQDNAIVWFFSITALGRELITSKQSKDIPKRMT